MTRRRWPGTCRAARSTSRSTSASAAVAPRCGPAISPTATSRSTQITGASAVAAGSTNADRANSEGANSAGAAGEIGCWREDARAGTAAPILLVATAALVAAYGMVLPAERNSVKRVVGQGFAQTG